ncbi:MAG: R3H domain-containing nucleic acid-binding protein [Candidatus Staskawiczbacteria bacterium]|jgi:spoIIIJ-associated protein
MLEKAQIEKIKNEAEEFFVKMTIPVLSMEAVVSSVEADKAAEVVNLDVKLEEPQILIGQGGQTLFEIQRLLKTILNKKLQKVFYFNLDINDYKKKKIEYLKSLAKELADQVSLTKEEKSLLPMPSYERRIIHAELAERTDVLTESKGDGFDRHIVIKPR